MRSLFLSVTNYGTLYPFMRNYETAWFYVPRRHASLSCSPMHSITNARSTVLDVLPCSAQYDSTRFRKEHAELQQHT